MMKYQRLWPLLLLLIVSSTYAQHYGRDSWQQPERIMDSLQVVPGMVIGEAGTGDGYFTFHLAKRVGDKGTVYANDIDDDALEALMERAKREKVTNIQTIVGEISDPLFPKGKMDMILMMRAFHDFTEPVMWMKNAAPALKRGAFMVIIDLNTEKRGNRDHHFLTRKEVLDIMSKTDFELVKIYDFLARDLIFVFQLKEME